MDTACPLNVDYHSNDFDIDDYLKEIMATGKLKLPVTVTEYSESHTIHWNIFYSRHIKGSFFKYRRYLSVEFFVYLSDLNQYDVVLEVGCGYGCSMFPLLEAFNFNYIATDYSDVSLQVLSRQPIYDSIRHRCLVKQWDIVQPFPPDDNDALDYWSRCGISGIKCVLCVFALSAVHPALHVDCLRNMKSILLRSRFGEYEVPSDNIDNEELCSIQSTVSSVDTTKGRDGNRRYILFRDYGMHDMTMYRHSVRHSDLLYRRSDGTLAYYFNLPYVQYIAEAAGLKVVELQYATVRVVNRKQSSAMHRIFVHAVLCV